MRNCCRVSARSVYTIQPRVSLQCHFIACHMRTVHVRLAVTSCHLYFRRNDQDLLPATAVARGWNGYFKESQHRKLTLENKILRPPVLELDRTDDLSTTSDAPPVSCPFGLLPSSASEFGDAFVVQIAQFSFHFMQ